MSTASGDVVVEVLERKRMSYEEYLALPEHVHAEWVDGVVVVSPSADVAHQKISRRLANCLDAALPGTTVVEAVTVRMPGNRERVPDIVVLARDPVGGWPDVAIDGAPLAVVEILSPSTRAEDWIRKSQDYLAAGIGQYWLVDPQTHELTVLEIAEGEWRELARLGEGSATAGISVADHGTVQVDLEELLA